MYHSPTSATAVSVKTEHLPTNPNNCSTTAYSNPSSNTLPVILSSDPPISTTPFNTMQAYYFCNQFSTLKFSFSIESVLANLSSSIPANSIIEDSDSFDKLINLLSLLGCSEFIHSLKLSLESLRFGLFPSTLVAQNSPEPHLKVEQNHKITMQRNTSSKEGLFSNIDSSLETENVEMLTKSPLNSNTTHVNLNQVTNTNHKLTATDSASQNITNHSHLYISPTSNFASPSHVLQTHPIEYSSPTLPEAIENHNQIGLNCVEHASESIQSPTPVESKVLKLASPSRDPGSDSFQLPHIESFSTRVAPTKVITQEPNSLCSSSLNTWPVPQSSTSIGSRFQSCMNSSKSPLNSHINYGKRDVDMSTSNLESQNKLGIHALGAPYSYTYDTNESDKGQYASQSTPQVQNRLELLADAIATHPTQYYNTKSNCNDSVESTSNRTHAISVESLMCSNISKSNHLPRKSKVPSPHSTNTNAYQRESHSSDSDTQTTSAANFNNETPVEDHDIPIKKIRLDGNTFYECTYENCQKRFTRPYNLKSHFRAQHTSDRPYACTECPFKFARKYDMLRHTKIHKGTREYKCQYCRKEFGRKEHLRNHLRDVQSGKKSYCSGVKQIPIST